MISAFFTSTFEAKTRESFTITSVILASPCGNIKTMQASSTYTIPHTARQPKSIVGSGPIEVRSSSKCTSSARRTVPLLNLWRTTASTAAKEMLNNSGDSTRLCRSLCSTLNQSEKMLSSGQTQALIPSYHLQRYSDASEYLPQEGAVNGVVCLLEIYEARKGRYSCPPPNYLQPAHHKHHIRGPAR